MTVSEIPALLRGAVPANCTVLRDRGSSLYRITAKEDIDLKPLTDFGYAVSDSKTFLARGESTYLSLTETLAVRLSECADSEDKDFLVRSLRKTENYPFSAELLPLIHRGIKLLEAPNQRETELYEREVRQAAAVCLRTKTSGIFLCAKLLHEIKEL